MKKGILFTVVLLAAFILWLAWPTYKFRHIKLKGCPDKYLTEIEYTKLFYRGFAYTNGIYTRHELPKDNCVISGKMTGIDSILELWVVCSNDGLTVYPASSFSYVSASHAKIHLGEVEPWEYKEKVINRKDVTAIVTE